MADITPCSYTPETFHGPGLPSYNKPLTIIAVSRCALLPQEKHGQTSNWERARPVANYTIRGKLIAVHMPVDNSYL